MSEQENVQLWRFIVHANDGSIYWQTSRYTSESRALQILENLSHSYGGRPKASHTTMYSEEEYRLYQESKK